MSLVVDSSTVVFSFTNISTSLPLTITPSVTIVTATFQYTTFYPLANSTTDL